MAIRIWMAEERGSDDNRRPSSGGVRVGGYTTCLVGVRVIAAARAWKGGGSEKTKCKKKKGPPLCTYVLVSPMQYVLMWMMGGATARGDEW